MAETQRDKIEYDFEDLRRNEDPVPDIVLGQLGLEDEDLTDDERHDDKKATDDREELDDKDDADAEMDDELDDDGEYNPAKMTGAMRKRLMKVKRDANRAIAAAKEEAGEEISKLTKRIAELERSGKTEQIEDEFGGKLEDLEAKMEAAMEKGDSKEVTSLTRQMSELTADMRDKKRELEQQRDEPDDVEDEADPKIIPRAAEWVKEQDWWDDDEYGHIREFVRKADIALQKKGYKPTDDDFYEQLENLVEKKYPGIVVQTVDDDDADLDLDEEIDEEDDFEDVPDKRRRAAKKKRGRRRSPVSEGDRGGVSRAAKKVRKKRGKTLTRARVKNMEVFGMDPENPDHVEAYLDNNP